MKKLEELIENHLKFCEQAPPGPWDTDDNHKTGMKEVWGEKNIHGDKIFEIKRYDPKALDFIVFSRELLPRYVKALEFLTQCYEYAIGEDDSVCKDTLDHVEQILQGVD